MGKVFTSNEILQALRENRVFFVDPVEAHSADYPYVVFAQDPAGMLVADAWHVGVSGSAHPHEVVAVPVALVDVSHIDFAPPGLRLPFMKYSESPPCHEGFANIATSMVAEVLSSESQAWDVLRKAGALPKAGCPDVDPFKRALVPFLRSNQFKLFGHALSFSDVRWDQVAGMFDVENAPFPSENMQSLSSDEDQPGEQECSADRTTPVDEDVLRVLGACTLEGVVVKLPAGTLERKLYERTNAVLVALGGKWVGRKTQGHVFEADPSALLDAVLSTGRVLRPQDMGYFPTPDDVAMRVIELAQLSPGMTVLEPSGGRGALALRAAEAVGGLQHVTVCEIMDGNVRKLREAGFADSNVIHADFLSMTPAPIFDRVVMNPPFSGLQDIEHFLHAAKFLKPEGRIVSVMSPGWQFRSTSKATAFRELVAESDAEVQEVEAGAFKASGTDIRTTIVSVDAENFPWNQVERPRDGMRA